MRLDRLAACFGLLLIYPIVRADDPPVTRTADCRWAAVAPTIDGKLDDPAWKEAAVIEHFPAFWSKTDLGPQHAMKVRIVWDRDALYFAATMTDADVRAYGTRHNDFLWNGDVFEMFFKPSRDRPEYFEFQVNPRSTLFEAAFLARNKATEPFETSKPMGMTAVAVVDGSMDQTGDTDKGWSVEGKIPWTAFGPKFTRPEPGTAWSFALCRYDYFGPAQTPPVLMSSAPLLEPKFHRFEDFGLLHFMGPTKP